MIATQGEGIEALADACETHHAHLLETGKMASSEAARARQQIVALARGRVLAGLLSEMGEERLEELADRVADRATDPHSAADVWVGG